MFFMMCMNYYVCIDIQQGIFIFGGGAACGKL
jgi:hypothetical protein